MKKALIIVESPAKIKTIKKILGPSYSVASSVGHIRDLPKKTLGIDIEKDFEPAYEQLEDKKKVIADLKKKAKESEIVYLAPDPDREGEAIAWHIMNILPKGTKFERITFNQITKQTVLDGLKNPRDIDLSLVNAQQARRLLDRLVGYKLSPVVHRKIQQSPGSGFLSAGRVQSVALKLIVLRERLIEAFKPVEYWNLGATVAKNKDQFEINLTHIKNKKVEIEVKNNKTTTIETEARATAIKNMLDNSTYTITSIEKKQKRRHPAAPFITSTLQQEAARHYGFSAVRTMSIAQGLYEGIEIQGNTEGLITYMRTDSVRIAESAQYEAKVAIEKKYGASYVPLKPPVYKDKKKNVQDAHEAIRPTFVDKDPESLKDQLEIDQYKIYKLIYNRFIASQMKSALYDSVSCVIDTDQELRLKATGQQLVFAGFLKAYEEKSDDESHPSNKLLPVLEKGETLKLIESFAKQAFTKPPARYTEASLIKELEKCGIGRPSTYSSIMQKIHSRAYTTKEKNTITPTELGKILYDLLETNFPKILDVQFTANMENDLDKIAENNADWRAFLREFWHTFAPLLEKASKQARVPKIALKKKCPKCGGHLEKIWAKGKYFTGCSNYPDCDYRQAPEEIKIDKSEYQDGFDWNQPCPKCGAEMKLRKSTYGVFLGCVKYPKCKTIVSIPKKGEELPENLPDCPAIGCDGKIQPRKSRFGKTFFSCSNYPDCNVIVNDIDDLATKYKDHKKTPYEKKAGGRGGRGSKKLKKEMAEFMGQKTASRGEITKKLWAYIKEHDLQNPDNRRQIVPDETLKQFFAEPIDMMKLASIISANYE